MKIFVVGATGFIGSHLIPMLLQQGHEVSAMFRSHHGSALLQKIASDSGKSIQMVQGDGTKTGEWQKIAGQSDYVINLAGCNIARNWSDKVKQEIYASRVEVTRCLVQALHAGQSLYNASAIGYYNYHESNVYTETSPSGNHFLASICQAWEKEAMSACERKVRVVVGRQGIALGHGGALEEMAKMYRHFLGSKLGSGQQWFTWIHMQDLLRAIVYFLEHQECQGVYNLCSPFPVRNEELSKMISKSLHIPAAMAVSIPSFVIKFAMGEAADVLLQGCKVYPQRLLVHGFQFQFEKLEDAVHDLLKDASWILSRSFLS